MNGSGIQEKRSGGLRQESREDHSIDQRDQEGVIKEKGKTLGGKEESGRSRRVRGRRVGKRRKRRKGEEGRGRERKQEWSLKRGFYL